jgi:hypothetical protein
MRHRINRLFAAAMLLAPPTMGGCISTNSDLSEAGKGCPELSEGAQSADVDASVRLFMQAAADFRVVSADLKAAVKTACANIAIDLGAEDTWSDLGDDDDAIANGSGTGACDAANARIVAIMELQANANFALAITRGACHCDFQAQAACDAQCKAEATCDSGSVETRCEPAALSVLCEGSCEANAFCEGTMDVAANCMGQCESTCQGECKGTCIAPDGTKTDGDPNCHGKCSSSCNGTCRGLCKVEAESGVNCGANVSCRGGCSGTFTEPQCTTTFLPPVCTVDQACLDSCSAQVAKNAVCDPPHVELMADVTVSADVQLLVDTINANLPALIALADAQGEIILKAAETLSATGKGVLDASGDLDGKSIACATAAAKASFEAAATLEVSVGASTRVTEGCSSHSE